MSELSPRPASEQTLLCHPLTPAPAVRLLRASVARLPDGGLLFSYRLSGDMVRLLIPEAHEPGRREGLWEHSCFEAFIAIAGQTAYRELNFSPSGQWAAFSFSGYRQRHPENAAAPGAPGISVERSAGRLQLDARVAADLLPPGVATAALEIGLTAVVESRDTVDGPRSYWALRHAPERPDFHRRDSFVIKLPAA